MSGRGTAPAAVLRGGRRGAQFRPGGGTSAERGTIAVAADHGTRAGPRRRLFIRDRRSVALIPAGAALLPGARTLLERADELRRRAEQLSGAGSVRLGYVNELPPTWSRSPSLRHRAAARGHLVLPSHAQAARVADGSLDLALCLGAHHRPRPNTACGPGRSTPWPGGAANPVTASDQRFRDQPRPAPVAQTPASMIARCDSPTRVPLARPHAELAGATRPVNRDQGHRDLGAPSRGRRAAPTPPRPMLTSPGTTAHFLRAEQAPTHAAAPAAAGVTQNPAALARPHLIARRWTYPRRQPGRPPTPQPIRAPGATEDSGRVERRVGAVKRWRWCRGGRALFG